MHFRLEQRFDAPLEAVESAFVDPDLLAHLSGIAELGHPELIDQAVAGDTVRQRVKYRFTGDLTPAIAAVLDRDRLTWVEESELDRRTHCQTFRIVPDFYGERLRCSGTVTLGKAHGGTVRLAEADLEVRFPFVGQTVARTIVAGLVENAATQQQAVADWLSTHPYPS
ncbi:MAG: hypothetical protein QOD63_1489 [Actinomycetota bacterium]|jgi:hypothetical protein|nr:hypothetical protein [Actinomycetota bacterium]